MHRNFGGFDMKSLYFIVRLPTYMLEMKNLIIYSFMQLRRYCFKLQL